MHVLTLGFTWASSRTHSSNSEKGIVHNGNPVYQLRKTTDPIVKVYKPLLKDEPDTYTSSSSESEIDAREVQANVINDPVPSSAQTLYRYNNYSSADHQQVSPLENHHNLEVKSARFSDTSLDKGNMKMYSKLKTQTKDEKPLSALLDDRKYNYMDSSSESSESFMTSNRNVTQKAVGAADGGIGHLLSSTEYHTTKLRQYSTSYGPVTTSAITNKCLNAKGISSYVNTVPVSFNLNNWMRGDFSPTWRVPSTLKMAEYSNGSAYTRRKILERKQDEEKLARLKQRILEQQQERQQRETQRQEEEQMKRKLKRISESAHVDERRDLNLGGNEDINETDNTYICTQSLTRKVTNAGKVPSYKGFSDSSIHKFESNLQPKNTVSDAEPLKKFSKSWKKPSVHPVRHQRVLKSQSLPKRKVVTLDEDKPSVKQSLITPSSWRIGQQTVLRELGPSPSLSPSKATRESPPTKDPTSSGTERKILENKDGAKPDVVTAMSDEDESCQEEKVDELLVPNAAGDKCSAEGNSNKDAFDGVVPVDQLSEATRNILQDVQAHFESDSGKNYIEKDNVTSNKKPKNVISQRKKWSKRKKALKPPAVEHYRVQKVRHYDPVEVRQYIEAKKQEKKKQLLEDRKQKKIAADERKNKLQELARKQKKAAEASIKNSTMTCKPDFKRVESSLMHLDDIREEESNDSTLKEEATLVEEASKDAKGENFQLAASMLDAQDQVMDESVAIKPLDDVSSIESESGDATEVATQTSLKLLEDISNLKPIHASSYENLNTEVDAVKPDLSSILNTLNQQEENNLGNSLKAIGHREKVQAVMASANSLQLRVQQQMNQLKQKPFLSQAVTSSVDHKNTQAVLTRQDRVGGSQDVDMSDEDLPGNFLNIF